MMLQEKLKDELSCALGDAAAMPVQSFIQHYREEFVHYVEHGHSIVAEQEDAA